MFEGQGQDHDPVVTTCARGLPSMAAQKGVSWDLTTRGSWSGRPRSSLAVPPRMLEGAASSDTQSLQPAQGSVATFQKWFLAPSCFLHPFPSLRAVVREY